LIITNKHNLPQAFVKMASEDYTFRDKEYRVTSLLKGLRETILERRHHENIEVDVSDMIWLLFGRAVHSILEQQEEAGHELKEERIRVPIGDYTLSGQFDLYCGKTHKITDYKTCSTWKIIFGDYNDWRQQLLIYSWMMRQIGFPVKCAEVVALMKDHSKRDAKRKADYPKLPAKVVSFKFGEQDFQEIEEWLIAKFAEIKHAETLPDDELPLCTPDERFNSGDKFAVMNKGRKTALRVLDSQDDAERWMAVNGKGDYIEVRPGEDKKCIDYCRVSAFCNYAIEKGYGGGQG